MAVFAGSPTGSEQFNKQTGVTVGGVYGGEVFADLHVARFSYTHAAGAGTGEINLINLPPGPLIIFPDLCRIVIPDLAAAAAVVDLGHRANTTYAGVVIAADGAAFANDLAAGAGAIDQAWPLPADGDFDISNSTQLTVFATVAAGDIANGETIRGFVVWAGGAQG